MDSTLSLLVKFAALDRLTAPLRTMSGGARKAAMEIAATRKEVLELEKRASRIAGYRKLEAEIDKSRDAAAAARTRIDELKTAMAEATGPTGRLAQQLAAAEARAIRFDQKAQDQVDRLGQLGENMRDVGVDVGDLARSEGDLADRIAEANRRLEEQRARSDRAAAAAARLEAAGRTGANLRAGGTRAIAAGMAIGLPSMALAATARDFDSTMTDIALKANMTAQATERMKASLQAAAPVAGQLPADLAAGVDALVGLGQSVSQALKNAPVLGRAATAYKADMLDLANASFSVSDNLKVAQKDIARTLDVMAVAGKAGAFELKDMAYHFPALTASAQALGQKGVPAVADLAAALQIARKGAGDAATAANNLQNLLNKINTKDTYDNFKKMGVDLPAALKQAAKAGKSPIEAIVEQTMRATKGDLTKLAFVFQDAQVQAALRPLVQNLDLYRKIRADALQASGAVEGDFQRRMKLDGAARLAKFNAQWEVMKQKLGDRLLPMLNNGLDRLGAWIDRISAWSDQNPRLAQGLAAVTATLAALLTILGSVGVAVGFIWRPLVMVWGWLARLMPVIRFIGGALGWILRIIGFVATGLAAFFGIPVEIVVAIGVAIAAAGYLIYRYWDKIKGWFSAGWNWLASMSMRFGQIGVQLVMGLVNGIGSMFGALKNKIMALGRNAVGWFKNVLGIHSPSRVFADLGGHMMGGLALGLDRAAERPLARVRAVGRTLARTAAITLTAGQPAAALATPPATTAAASSTIGEVHIHIHAQPNQDADAIAQAVRRELEKVARAKASSRRASYADAD